MIFATQYGEFPCFQVFFKEKTIQNRRFVLKTSDFLE